MTISHCEAYHHFSVILISNLVCLSFVYILEVSLVKTFAACARQQNRKNLFYFCDNRSISKMFRLTKNFDWLTLRVSRCWLISHELYNDCNWVYLPCKNTKARRWQSQLSIFDIWWETRIRSAFNSMVFYRILKHRVSVYSYVIKQFNQMTKN